MVAGLGWKGGFWMNLCVFFMMLGRVFLDFGTKTFQRWYIYRLVIILCFKPTLIFVWHDTLFLVNEIKWGKGAVSICHFIFLANFHWLASWQGMHDIKKQMSLTYQVLWILRYPKYRQEVGIDFIVLFVLVGEEILLWKEMYFESNLIENTHMRSHCRATELFGHGCALVFLCNCVFVFV